MSHKHTSLPLMPDEAGRVTSRGPPPTSGKTDTYSPSYAGLREEAMNHTHTALTVYRISLVERVT